MISADANADNVAKDDDDEKEEEEDRVDNWVVEVDTCDISESAHDVIGTSAQRNASQSVSQATPGSTNTRLS